MAILHVDWGDGTVEELENPVNAYEDPENGWVVPDFDPGVADYTHWIAGHNSHTYNEPGTYTVDVDVRYFGGVNSSAIWHGQFTVTVTEPDPSLVLRAREVEATYSF